MGISGGLEEEDRGEGVALGCGKIVAGGERDSR